MEYKPTIGLEVHAELKTKTKMFCDCPNNLSAQAGPDAEKPNSNVCPVCLGHPGTLPVINKKAIEAIIKIGLAIKGEINETFKFDRKNYFYPDLSKGYQISQFDMPIIKGGSLDISARLGQQKIVKINRVHLEEDAGKLVHSTSFADLRGLDAEIADKSQRSQPSSAQSASLVDFNRGGVPLMELVSEPDINSAKEATAFAKELQLILRYLGVSDADMEKGQMRVDANISLKTRISTDQNTDKHGLDINVNPFTPLDNLSNGANRRKSVSTLGTKVEIKNLNSFKAIEQAIGYEIKRQEELLENGEKIKQETRGWNDAKQITESQRSKEESHDYRYFPEPDLPPLTKDGFNIEKIKMDIPELPNEKRKRFSEQYKLSAEQMNVLIEDKEMSDYFEQSISELESDNQENINPDKIKLTLNYLTSDLRGLLISQKKDFIQSKITPENFADLIDMILKKEITSRVAKDLLAKMLETGLDPRELVKNEGLQQISDESGLVDIVIKIIKENPKPVEDYKKGKEQAVMFLIGKTMAILKGRGNPEILKKLFKENI